MIQKKRHTGVWTIMEMLLWYLYVHNNGNVAVTRGILIGTQMIRKMSQKKRHIGVQGTFKRYILNFRFSDLSTRTTMTMANLNASNDPTSGILNANCYQCVLLLCFQCIHNLQFFMQNYPYLCQDICVSSQFMIYYGRKKFYKLVLSVFLVIFV